MRKRCDRNSLSESSMYRIVYASHIIERIMRHAFQIRIIPNFIGKQFKCDEVNINDCDSTDLLQHLQAD